jgi:hypothetical protein
MEKKKKQTSCEGDPFDLSNTFLTDKEYVGDSTKSSDKASQQFFSWREVNYLSLLGSELVPERMQDSDIMVLRQRVLPLVDASKEPECYYLRADIPIRTWRPPDALLSEEWRQVHQIVVPKIYRQEIIELFDKSKGSPSHDVCFSSSPWLWLQPIPDKYQRLLPTSQLAH